MAAAKRGTPAVSSAPRSSSSGQAGCRSAACSSSTPERPRDRDRGGRGGSGRMDRLDSQRLAGLGGEVVEVERDDELGVGGDRSREDVAVLLLVRHRRLEAVDLGGVDFGFVESLAHRGVTIRAACGSVIRRSTRLRGISSRIRALQRGAYRSRSARRSRVSRSEKRIENVRVEDGGEDHGGGATLAPPRRSTGSRPRPVQRARSARVAARVASPPGARDRRGHLRR